MKKGKKKSFGTLKTCFLGEFSLAELGGTPTPLTDNNCAQQKLGGKGGYPPPLNGQNPL